MTFSWRPWNPVVTLVLVLIGCQLVLTVPIVAALVYLVWPLSHVLAVVIGLALATGIIDLGIYRLRYVLYVIEDPTNWMARTKPPPYESQRAQAEFVKTWRKEAQDEMIATTRRRIWRFVTKPVWWPIQSWREWKRRTVAQQVERELARQQREKSS